MATRQTNKKSTSRKTSNRKKSKSNSAGKSVFLGIGLIAVLIALISFGVMSITNSKEKEEVKTVTVIPAKKNNVDKKNENTKKDVAKKETVNKNIPVPNKNIKQEDKKEEVKNENISDLIRLVLFDHEISRSSVEERKLKNNKGKEIIYFDIVCDENMQKGLSNAISSILKKNGYKVDISKNKIVGISSRDEYNIILQLPKREVAQVKEQVATKDDKKVDSNVKTIDNKTQKDATIKTPKKQTSPKVEDNATKYPPLPPYTKKAVNFAILLDDGGNSAELAKEYANMKYPVAVAVLPHLEHSRYTAEVAKKAGKTVFLHFPMAPKSYPNTDPGKGAVTPSMPEILIDGVVKENFESLGVKVDGFNNHMGSAITEDAHKMSQILSSSKKYTNRFIDSRTTAQTKAFEECMKAGFKCGENKLFLDNDNSVEAILAKIYEAALKAKDEGSIITIGHIRPNTLEALKIALPQLEKLNYHIVDIKNLVK